MRGQRLPTHRSLAKALDVDLTTVTRAYGEARRRGLIDARVGQGTFVSETTARNKHAPVVTKIDLSMNIPPQPVEANLDLRIAQGLKAIQDDYGFSAFLNYQRAGGALNDAAAAAKWLRKRAPHADAERIVIAPGNQSIVFNTLLALTSRGDTVVTEALTFPGIKAAAVQLGLRLVGAPMDAEGIIPEGLAKACKAHKPKIVYLTPTQHNPTTATMGVKRREAVAEVIRRNDAILIEDDAYGALEPGIAPIAALIPERTYLAAGLAKCIAPALRVSYALMPNEAAVAAMRNALQATVLMPPPLMVALATHWLQTGIADKIIQAIRAEARGRQALAAKILKGISYISQPYAHHIWLPMPAPVYGALHRGLAVVSDEVFAVGAAPSGVRVCLGAARNREELAQALEFLAETARNSAQPMPVV